jgi:two-component system, cell cycle sensor histidine kinase and response regulator CckA
MKSNDSHPSTAFVICSETAQLDRISILMRNAGFEAIVFPSLEHALSRADPNAPPEVLIVFMPGADIGPMSRQLQSRNYAPFKRTPLIVVSMALTEADGQCVDVNVNADALFLWPRDEPCFIEKMQAIRTGSTQGLPLRLLMAEELLKIRTRELQESEERYWKIKEAVSDYIYTVQIENGAAVRTIHSPGCHAVTGYQEEEFNRDPFLWLDMVPSNDRERVIEHARRVAAGETVASIEHQVIRKDGEMRWMRNTPVLHRDERGILLRYDGLIHDITRQKRIEMQLQHSHDRYQQLVEHARDGIFTINADGLFSFVNEGFCKILGYAREELFCLNILDTYPDEMRDVGWDRLARIRSGENIQFERSMKCKDGSFIIIEANGWKTEEGQIQAIVRDITERKRAEEALRHNQALLQAIAEGTSDVIFAKDIQGRYLLANSSTQKLLGKPKEEIIGKDDTSFFPSGDARHFIEIDRKVMNSGQILTYEETISIHGRPATFLSTKGPLFDANGCVMGLFGIARDITERKNAREMQAKLQEQLIQAQKMESVGRLAGGVAHDFNNMLSAIMMNIGLAETYPIVDPRIKQILREVQSDASRAANLTRQLLLFSRRSVMNRRLLNINDVASGMIKMLDRLIGENISLHFSRKEDLPAVKADEGMLEQVLMNLAVNARDAMPKGGHITIDIEVVDVGAEQIASRPEAQPGRFVCLSVSDTGFGMDDNILEHIFEPFFTTKELGKGTGLGLATVYGIVAQHQGWVAAASEAGKGSTFRIFLPAVQESAPKAIQAEKIPILRGHETILLVEDDPGLRMIMSQGLSLLGYTVISAGDGQEAIQKWQEHHSRIHMLFSDMVMPEELTGIDLAEKFKISKPDLKVIITSGYSPETVGEAPKHGLFLQKPYTIEEMAKSIRDSFDKISGNNAG